VSDRALYVYGVVPSTADAALFEGVDGIDPSKPVALVVDGEVAAVTSGVRLDEFGEDAIEQNLRDPAWLAEKARAHDHVLGAAVGRTTVLPFRFGAIYRSEEQIRDLLRRRADFPSTLARLEGALELGVKAAVDVAALRERLAAHMQVEEDVPAGRAYMQRKQRERELEEAAERFAADCAQEVHGRLAAGARDARANPVQQPDESASRRRMILNGAYLVDADAEPGFHEEVGALERTYAVDGVDFELTGPWPPYNFSGDGEDAP
jgi:hypothetical protein